MKKLNFDKDWKTIFGKIDKNNTKNIINITRFTTKIGAMFACATNKGLCLLDFTDRKMLETEFKDLCKRLNAVILLGENKHLDLAQIQLNEYLDGTRLNFDIPLDLVGTDFQKRVWHDTAR